jgi:anti-sigma factor RsiW
MPSPADHTTPTTRELAELSALADGSLDPSRRASVEAQIAASPELSALYERERRVAGLLAQARASDRAPAGLRQRIETARPRQAKVARRRIAYAGGLVGVLAAAALAAVLLLPSSTPGSPSVSDAAALATLGVAQPGPPPDPAHPQDLLDTKVGAVYFPNWTKSFGMPAVGARTDELSGHKAVTVYYQWQDTQIAYTIVSGPVLPQPAAQTTVLHGTELRTLSQGGRVVVTWRQGGVTCVLSATKVPPGILQRLAAWNAAASGTSA